MNQEYKFKTTGEMLINFKPSYTITIGNADGEVGRLDFSGPKLIFTGDAEESAKVFLDYVALSWSKRLQEERAAEREACAKVCDEKYEAVPESDPYAEADGDYSELIYAGAAQDCADAIRARGEV